VLAGCDAILVCASRDVQERAVEALRGEAESSPAFASLVERSVSRVQALRRNLAPAPEELERAPIRSTDHLELASGTTR